jgi:carbonic anhydrase
MYKTISSIIVMIVLISAFPSCQNGSETKPPLSADTVSKPAAPTQVPLKERVLTKAEQDALTPDMVIQSLKDGNKRYMNNDLTQRDHSSLVRDASSGQYPKAVILSCLDSRVPVEDVFDKGIGDIFVGRVAGNFVNVDLLGSMEFGCKVSGAKLIVVMGHESCGAIKSAIDNVKLGNITAMLSKIQPAVKKSGDFNGEKSSRNSVFVDYVGRNNVLIAIENIKKNSPILKEMLDKGQIKIIGAYYSVRTGEVTFL